jgi:hypothetical protein
VTLVDGMFAENAIREAPAKQLAEFAENLREMVSAGP